MLNFPDLCLPLNTRQLTHLLYLTQHNFADSAIDGKLMHKEIAASFGTPNWGSVCRRLILVTVLLALAVLSACSTRQEVLADVHSFENAELPRIAVIGVSQAFSPQGGLNTIRLPNDLAALLAGTGDTRVTSADTVRLAIGGGPYDEIMATYARYAQLTNAQIQRLMAAKLPASRALLVRLESDKVEELPALHEDVFDTLGRRLADREKQIYIVRRTTDMSAQLLDLRNGNVLWSRQYRVSPETRSVSSRRVGGDFGASLAENFKNTLVGGAGGARSTQYPSPASLRDSVMALLQEIAYSVPID